MDLELTGKVALVCAASEGIGKGIAMGLAKEGADVCIFSRSEDKVKQTVAEIKDYSKGRVIGLAADLSVAADRVRVIELTKKNLGDIDILIHNQGGPAPGTLLDLNETQLDSAIETNIRSVFHLTKLCLEDMRKKNWGRIVNILSLSAKEALPNMLLSNMMRPAILGFAKTLANENAKFGITVNSLLPAAVLSERTMGFMRKAAETQNISVQAAVENSGKNIPIGHIATPEEFAQLALFLCSPKASYITGTTIQVDGGICKGII